MWLITNNRLTALIYIYIYTYMHTYMQGIPLGFATDLWSLHCRVSSSERSHEDIRASWPLYINVTVLCVYVVSFELYTTPKGAGSMWPFLPDVCADTKPITSSAHLLDTAYQEKERITQPLSQLPKINRTCSQHYRYSYLVPERHSGPARLHSALCERRQEALYLFDA